MTTIARQLELQYPDTKQERWRFRVPGVEGALRFAGISAAGSRVSDGRRDSGAADCLRERGEPAARARDSARKGDRDPRGAGCESRAADSPASGGKFDTRGAGRRRGNPADALDHEFPNGLHAASALADRIAARRGRPHSRVHACAVDLYGRDLRPRAGAADDAAEREHIAQRWRPHGIERSRPAPPAKSSGRDRNDSRRRAARRSRIAGAQLAHGSDVESRLSRRPRSSYGSRSSWQRIFRRQVRRVFRAADRST